MRSSVTYFCSLTVRLRSIQSHLPVWW